MTEGLSLRERLEGKKRRRLTVPVRIGNPEPFLEAIERATSALAAAAINGAVTDEELQALAADEAAARAGLNDCVVMVDFQALEPDDFERLVAEHTLADPKEGALVDSGALLPVLAAYCAVDQSLRDVEWWTAHLATPVWSAHEKADLYYRLFNSLHYALPTGALGKG